MYCEYRVCYPIVIPRGTYYLYKPLVCSKPHHSPKHKCRATSMYVSSLVYNHSSSTNSHTPTQKAGIGEHNVYGTAWNTFNSNRIHRRLSIINACSTGRTFTSRLRFPHTTLFNSLTLAGRANMPLLVACCGKRNGDTHIQSKKSPLPSRGVWETMPTGMTQGRYVYLVYSCHNKAVRM